MPIAAIGCVAILCLLAVAGSAAAARPVPPTADAYVSAARPTVSYGASAILRLDASPAMLGYLRFDLTGLSGRITRAELRLFARKSSSRGFAVHAVTPGDWDERSLTFRNAPRPQRGPPAVRGGKARRLRAGQWTRVDVTDLIRAGERPTLALTTTSKRGLWLAARESASVSRRQSGSTAPRLVVQVAKDQPAPDTITGDSTSLAGGGSDPFVLPPIPTLDAMAPEATIDSAPVVGEQGSAGPTAPDTTLDSGPSGTTTSTAASFGFSSSAAGSSFECRLDGGSFGVCSSPHAYTGLAEGSHSFEVRAIDVFGTVDPTPAARAWTVASQPSDTTPPETAITSAPVDGTTSTDASFEFNSSETGSTFECQLDSGPVGACSSPRSYSGLSTGSHTFRVWATDPAGNTDATPAGRTWTISSPPPPPPPPNGGTTYYVDSVAGNDSSTGTSEASAWRSLAKANSAPLAPGDRLLFRRGGSWSSGLNLTRSGTAASPIVVGSYGTGALPQFSGTGSDCIELSASHVTLKEIEVDGCAWAGIYLSGGNNRIEDSRMLNNVAGVSVRPGAVGNKILNNDVRDNNRMSVNTVGGDDDSGAFGILLRGDDTEIAYNRISGSDALSYDYGRDGAAVQVYGGQDNHVHHNLAVDNLAFTELGGSPTSGNTFAYNIVRSALTDSRFLITRGSQADTRVYNNSVRLTGSASQGFVCHGGCSASILRMRNNVIEAVAKVGYADAAFDEDRNLYWGGQAQFAMGPNSRSADPRFVSPSTGDLRLQSGSPAIDMGTEVGYTSDFDRNAVPADGDGNGSSLPDAGAFEYGWGGGPPPPPGDTTSPETTIDSTQISGGSTDASFSFSSSEPGSSFECQLDGGSVGACTSPKSYSRLAAGEHTFSVWATDQAGNRDQSPATHTWTITSPPGSPGTMKVAAVGDIQPDGSSSNAVATGNLANAADFILGLGDYQYSDGAMSRYNAYFDKSWGKNVHKMYPVLAPNHDQYWRDADPMRYFNGAGASGVKSPVTLRPHQSYSFDRGGWHFMAIDDSCYRDTANCSTTNLLNWVKSDLAASSARCTVAYWHQPYWSTSSSGHSRYTTIKPIVQELHRAGVDVALSGHQHGYERFHPQTPDDVRDEARGIRAFIVGTGGIGFYSWSSTAAPNSVTRQSNTYGVLMLTLDADTYSWEFQRAAGGTYSDGGSGSCH